MGKTGVINRDFTGEENNVYHDVIRLFKIYRAVNWRMQIKVNQVKHRIREEYGTDLDEFLDSIYQAGMCPLCFMTRRARVCQGASAGSDGKGNETLVRQSG